MNIVSGIGPFAVDLKLTSDFLFIPERMLKLALLPFKILRKFLIISKWMDS